MVHSRRGVNGALCHEGLMGNIHQWGEALRGKISLAGEETLYGRIKVDPDRE